MRNNTMTHKKLQYTLLLTAHPWQSTLAGNALAFTEALLQTKHSLNCLFFYGDAVFIANQLITSAENEGHICQKWQQLLASHTDINAMLCATSSLKRGIIDNAYAKHYGQPSGNLAPGFHLKSLTTLITHMAASDRVIQFGGDL
jgi:tRNA 2-thiouridine synthesizing protein D